MRVPLTDVKLLPALYNVVGQVVYDVVLTVSVCSLMSSSSRRRSSSPS